MAKLSDLQVLLAEDEALVRQGMTALLEDEVGSITEVSDGGQALQALKERTFDLALIDIGLPVRTGLDVLSEIRSRKIPVKVILLTGDTHSYSPQDIMGAGADGFLYKTANASDFLEVINTVANGHSKPAVADNENNIPSIAQMRAGLTPREMQIVKLVVEGQHSKQIAKLLGISQHTVRKHREHVNRKLALNSPAALAAFAIKAKLV